MKFRQGNVFTIVCQEICPHGECLPHTPADISLGRHPREDTPLGGHPQWADTP